MPSIFQRLTVNCRQNRTKMINQDQRMELGRIVLSKWFELKWKNFPLGKLQSVEPEGIFTAVAYPKKFVPYIDKMILEYYKTISPPIKESSPKRKRIPTKPTPIRQYK